MGFLNYFRRSKATPEDLISIKERDLNYKNSWDYDLLDLLKNGEKQQLELILKIYSPLAAINEDNTVLLLFRHFQVQESNGERSILNCHPDDEKFQCGITIVKLLADGASSTYNVFLPNDIDYKELKIQKNEIAILTNDDNNVITNVNELSQKLWFKFKESEIEEGYKNLCNENYEKQKNKVKHKIIPLNSSQELVYNEDFEWYEGIIEFNKRTIDLSIQFCPPKKLKKVLAFVDDFLKSNSIEKVVVAMSEKMTPLRNDNWLEIDEATGEEAKKVTVEEFRKRIYIESIVFNDDCSSTIYCNDDELFWGHSIEISVDENGNFVDSNLAG